MEWTIAHGAGSLGTGVGRRVIAAVSSAENNAAKPMDRARFGL